jgi:hypothetical protein
MDPDEMVSGCIGCVFLLGMAAMAVLGLLIWGIVELVN